MLFFSLNPVDVIHEEDSWENVHSVQSWNNGDFEEFQ